MRVAVIDLDAPPRWFVDGRHAQARDHMTAQQARKFAGTQGVLGLMCVCHDECIFRR